MLSGTGFCSITAVKLAMTQMTIIDLFSKYLVYIDELSRKSFDFEIIFIVKIQRRWKVHFPRIISKFQS